MKTLSKKSDIASTRKHFFRLTSHDISAWVLMLPSLFLFFFIMWQPIYTGIKNSFFELKGYTAVGFVWLDNYKKVLSDTLFPVVLKNTFTYILWSFVIGFLPPFICAVFVNEMVHLKGYFKFSIYFPVIIPSVAVYMIWYFFYQPGEGGILNYFLSIFKLPPSMWLQNTKLTIMLIVLTMSWHSFGGTMITYLAALQGINQELYEAAKIDGAGILTRARVVIFPHMRGILLLMAIRQIIGVFQVMEQPLMMTGGGPNNASITIALQTYKYAFEYYKMHYSLALSTVTFCLLLILTVIYAFAERRIDQ